jgi:hypothetical protein
VSLSAAFCQSGEPLSYLEAGGSGYRGPTDPRFIELIHEVTFNLFPPQNSTLRRRQPGNCRMPGCRERGSASRCRCCRPSNRRGINQLCRSARRYLVPNEAVQRRPVALR